MSCCDCALGRRFLLLISIIILHETFSEGLKLKLFKQFKKSLHVRHLHLELIGNKIDRSINVNSGEHFRQSALFLIIDDVLFHFAFQLINMFKEPFHRAILLNEFRGSFLAHARNTGDIIARVTPKTKNINKLCRSIDTIFLAYLFRTEHLCILTKLRRTIDKDIFSHQLPEILVGCHHISEEARLLSFLSESANHVVSLIAFNSENRDIKSSDNLHDIRDRGTEVRRHLFTVSLIIGEIISTKGRSSKVEGDSEM